MVSVSSPEKVNEYLANNNLKDVFIFVIGSTDNLRCRGNLLTKNLTDLSQGLQRVLQKITKNPDVSPFDKEVSQMIKDLHYLELETIQRTSIFIELLAVYYHIMRSNLRDLPKAISERDINFTLSSEFSYFEKQSVEDIKRNFKYPNVEQFNELASDEKRELEEILEQSAKMKLELFKDIVGFNRHFRPIYNKYKHVMSEVTGTYGIDKANCHLQSHLFVRQKEIDQKNNAHYSVYMIPLSTDIIQYFDKIARSAWSLLMFLLDNQLLYFANEGRDFIPRHLLIHEEAKKQRFLEITKKITSYCAPNLQSILKVNAPTDAELKRKMDEAFKTDYLYVMNKDILDAEFLKTAEIARTETPQTPESTQINFEIVDVVSSTESWSTYRLKDGTILKVREVMIKAMRLPSFDPQGNPIYSVNSTPIYGVVPPRSVLGQESPPFTQEELTKSVVEPNMKFEIIQEPWNRYVLADGTEIETRAILETVSKTNKNDHFGEPIYVCTRRLDFKTNAPNKPP